MFPLDSGCVLGRARGFQVLSARDKSRPAICRDFRTYRNCIDKRNQITKQDISSSSLRPLSKTLSHDN
eukprot:1051351-Amphidinium_carterae.1